MKNKVIYASSIGNALEFFDFILYGAFFNIIASTFFPANDKNLSLLLSLGGFSVGFLMRPFGALIFGYFGDVIGRKKTLSISIFLMGIPTFLIGILPSYNEIGIFAPLLIVAGRLIQGVCIGGEYTGAYIFASEHAQKNPGLIGGIITSSCGVGAFAATGLNALTYLPELPEWCWRVPFLLGSCVSILGFYIRRNLSETPAFLNTFSTASVPILKTIKLRKPACVLSFTLGALIGALVYTVFGFLNVYVHKYIAIPLSIAVRVNLVSILVFTLSSPFLSMLYDKLPSFSFLRVVSYVLFFSMVPIFWLISSPFPLLILLGEITLALGTATIAGTGLALMQNLFPVKERYSGISFFFNLGMGILGGTAPIIYFEVIDGLKENLYFPAYYLMFLVSLFYGALLFIKYVNQKKKGKI
ncbi:MAG: MFS transporter [Proteobacteria bacterium]|nr:MFS transporter [Pseudomonadota bacterium]